MAKKLKVAKDSGRRQDSDQVNKHYTDFDQQESNTEMDSDLASTKRSADGEINERELGQLSEDESGPYSDDL